MTKAALKTLWSFFAGTLLSLSFLLFLRTTGVEVKGDSFGLLGYKAVHLPILGFPVDLFLLTVTLWLTRIWCVEVSGPTWAHRIPTFYFESKDIDPTTRGGRIYQAWVLGLSLFLPLALTVQMYCRFLAGSVFVNGSDKPTGIQGWNHFQVWSWYPTYGDAFLRYGGSDGPQYFPVEGWLFTLAAGAVAVYWIRVVRAIFVRPT
jgi:hypothetical protein